MALRQIFIGLTVVSAAAAAYIKTKHPAAELAFDAAALTALAMFTGVAGSYIAEAHRQPMEPVRAKQQKLGME